VTKQTKSTFVGFGADENQTTPVLTAFFTELLPNIDNLAELKLTLYAFWALSKQHGDRPHLRRGQLLADSRLMAALQAPGQTEAQALDDALERAAQRGTLLRAQIDGADDVFIFMNAPKGRAARRALQAGEWHPSGSGLQLRLDQDRPNIYVLYEQNIGALTPMIAERLQDATKEYPSGWLEEAMRIAVANNVRKWRYVEAILEDWKTKGRDEREDRRDPEATRRRYLGGEYSEYIEG
jgi:DNA replication protein